MKTLTLLRHAKSGWDDTVARDFDRPLNAKGRKAAQAIGRHLREEKLSFDHIVASPAQRVVEKDAALTDLVRRVLPLPRGANGKLRAVVSKVSPSAGPTSAVPA